MSTQVLRRAQLDEKVKKQIRQRVKKLLQQKQKDSPEQPGSVDEQSDPNDGDSEVNSEGTVYLFDASDHSSRRMVAIEFDTRKEFEQYKKDHDVDPRTKVVILDEGKEKGKKDEPGKKRGPGKDDEKGKPPTLQEKDEAEKGKKDEKPEDKTPGKDEKKPEDQGSVKTDQKAPGELREHSHPSRIPEGMHRQVAIKDKLIDEFGADAKNWKVHKLDPSQIAIGVEIRFPDGTSKKYGQLSPDEKGRVDRAIKEGLAASKGLSDYTNVSPSAFQGNMAVNLSRYDDQSVEEVKSENTEPATKENIGKFSSELRENGRTLLKKYAKSMSSISRPMAERFVDDLSTAVSEGIRDGSLNGVKEADLDEFVRESVKRILHQEVETRKRSLGDHGIRHVAGNCRSAMDMLGELQHNGIQITGKQKLMALGAMADHDIGYTVGEAATDIKKGKAHKEYSRDLVGQEPERYDKIFGKEDGERVRAIVATHDDPEYDWEKDPVSASVRLADNTSLFGKEKVQDLFLRSPKATGLACKLYLAAQAKPDDKNLQKVIKDQMHEVVDGDEFEEADRESLHHQIDEMTEEKFSTTKDILSRFSGKLDGFKFDPEKKMMNVNMTYSSEGKMVDQLFGDDVACKQFQKMSEGLLGAPIRGKRGNTLFKNVKGGKPAFQLNIDGFNEIDEPQTAAMRDFAAKTARTELTRASSLVSPPPAATEKDINKAKKAMEPAKEKFSKAEWDKLMKAFDEGIGDPVALAKMLGMWPLLQSEFAFLEGKTASERMIQRLVLSAIADRVAAELLGDTTLQEGVIVVAGRGHQTQRKDKDLMNDTGGISKNRQREPEMKPPRSDSHNRYRTKDKTPDQRDPDIDRKASGNFKAIARSELSRTPGTLREAVLHS